MSRFLKNSWLSLFLCFLPLLHAGCLLSWIYYCLFEKLQLSWTASWALLLPCIIDHVSICYLCSAFYAWRGVLSLSHYSPPHSSVVLTSVPEPGRKFLTVMVRPSAGKGASMTLLMRGCTKAGEISRLFSTSSKIWKKKTKSQNV